MKAVAPAPDHPYYLWQIVVQAHHLHQRGIEPVYPVYGTGESPSPLLQAIMASDLPATIHYVRDVRSEGEKALGYHASMKPWLMGWATRNGIIDPDEMFLYLDPDVIIAGDPSPWPDVISASDTDSYTGPDYLDGKGVLRMLCLLAGADYGLARRQKGYGAQYLLRGIEARVWEDIYRLSVEAYREMTRNARAYHPEGDQYPVQSWCSEMYLTQLVFLREGIVPSLDGMDFIWANGNLADWDRVRFFHDAGVTDEGTGHFCKITHQGSPFGRDLLSCLAPDSASRRYVGMIYDISRVYPDLVRKFSHG